MKFQLISSKVLLALCMLFPQMKRNSKSFLNVQEKNEKMKLCTHKVVIFFHITFLNSAYSASRSILTYYHLWLDASWSAFSIAVLAFCSRCTGIYYAMFACIHYNLCIWPPKIFRIHLLLIKMLFIKFISKRIFFSLLQNVKYFLLLNLDFSF